MKILMPLLTVILISQSVMADNHDIDTITNPGATSSTSSVKNSGPSPEPSKFTEELDGFNFGVGIGINSLKQDHIVNVNRVDDKVYVSDSESRRVQFWLEAHYSFGGDFTTKNCSKGCIILDTNGEKKEKGKNETYYSNRKIYHGPFFAVLVADGESLLNGAALGWMFSFRKFDFSETKKHTYFNVGLGYSTSKINTLSGQTDGMVLATDEQIREKRVTVEGLLLLFSVNAF